MKMRSNKGVVLIFALWVLGFLTVLALAVGFGTRQRIILLGRLEDRVRAQAAAEAAVKKAVAILIDDLENEKFLYSPAAKKRRHNNPEAFSGIEIDGRKAEVVCPSFDDASGQRVERPGLCDEQGKVNINTVDLPALKTLVANVLGLDPNAALTLATSILDWRDFGWHEVEGFFSDDYYKNLEFPYDMKEQPFERIDELLLVKGVDRSVYDRLYPFVTVYGDGHININTVSRPVLVAYGLDAAVADKILAARRGKDNIEATPDDHVFQKPFDVAVEVKALVSLEENEVRQIDALNARGILAVSSLVYSAAGRVVPDEKGEARSITVVFNGFTNKYEYWYEK